LKRRIVIKLLRIKKRLLTLSVLLLLLSTVVGCIVRKDSPAPGCIKYWGLAPMGGCFGKTVIMDLEVEPAIDCLTIEVNNCNGGVLEVSNSCDEPLVLGGVEITPQEYNVALDVLGKEDGRYLLTATYSNFSELYFRSFQWLNSMPKSTLSQNGRRIDSKRW